MLSNSSFQVGSCYELQDKFEHIELVMDASSTGRPVTVKIKNQ